jgi:hypothetical protein
MVDKPHRVLLERIAGYADEAAAYLRRRRLSRRPFARVYWRGGRSREFPASTRTGRSLFLAASRVMDAASAKRETTGR